MNAALEIRSRSRANDISLIALSDLCAVASTGLRHRVIGGQMVGLLHYTGTPHAGTSIRGMDVAP